MSGSLKPIFHLATLFTRCEAKTRIRHSDWSKLVGKKVTENKWESFLLSSLFVRTNSPSGKWA